MRKAGIPEDPRLAEMDKDSVKYELLKTIYEADFVSAAVKDAASLRALLGGVRWVETSPEADDDEEQGDDDDDTQEGQHE